MAVSGDAPRLGPAITRAASTQSYLTIRWLADRAYRDDAFALYGYFRWLDDAIDERLATPDERLGLVGRQRALLAGGHDEPADPGPHERLLVGLLRDGRGEPRPDADGARVAITAMLEVMEFDARRRGRPATGAQLDAYTRSLAVGVTEALHHCIGHGRPAPTGDARYVAVTGAHVTHMLRDLVEDLAAGYVNVPAELLADGALSVDDLHAPAFRDWVRERVGFARGCFAAGRLALAQVASVRCRLAGHAYIARFEWVLDAVERDGYRLRERYPQRRTTRGGLAIAAAGARSALASRRGGR